MKFSLFTLIFLLIGCSTRPVGETSPEVQKPIERVEKTSEPRPAVLSEHLSSAALTLQFRNIDDSKKSFTLNLEEKYTYKDLPQGHWELTGFAMEGKSFTSLNSSKKFVLSIKKKNISSYAGSYLVGCPRVKGDQLKLLKPMKFFNRYSFKGHNELCELVVGDNSDEIMKSLEIKKLKSLF